MPGPEKTAAEVKVIRGTFRPGRERRGAENAQNEPAPIEFEKVSALPPCPTGLRGDGRRMWRTLGPTLVKCGLLQQPDVYAFAQLCHAWQAVNAKWATGTPVSPAEHATLCTLFNAFGINPAARRRVARHLTAPAPAAKPNRFAGHGKPPAA